MKRIAVIGMGLMGGSLGLALKARGLASSVVGYARRAEARQEALDRGMVDEMCDSPVAAVSGADLVLFCVPVLTIPDLLRECVGGFKGGCVVTDVGSTKAELVTTCRGLLAGEPVTFVGSHPVAGSDETGMAAARVDLYDGATVVVTRDDDETASAAVQSVCKFWEQLGCHILVMSPDQHDRIIARTSHLPHIVAAALVRSVLREGMDEAACLCGTGFLDMTRIAAGSELMWHDIVKTNSATISAELARFEDEIGDVRCMIDQGDFDGIRAFLAQSRTQRRAVKGDSE